MIRFEHVSKTYPNGTEAVRNLSLEIAEGETLVLLGTSGCGKTTTLKMINRLIEPTSGHITINGLDIMQQNPIELRRSVGYVFQEIGLFPHMSVRRNVEITLRLLRGKASDLKARSEELLGVVGLDPQEYCDRYPQELSGSREVKQSGAQYIHYAFGLLERTNVFCPEQAIIDNEHIGIVKHMLKETNVDESNQQRVIETIRQVMNTDHKTFMYHLPLPTREPVYACYPLESSDGDALYAAHQKYQEIIDLPRNQLPEELQDEIAVKIPDILPQSFDSKIGRRS